MLEDKKCYKFNNQKAKKYVLSKLTNLGCRNLDRAL